MAIDIDDVLDFLIPVLLIVAPAIFSGIKKVIAEKREELSSRYSRPLAPPPPLQDELWRREPERVAAPTAEAPRRVAEFVDDPAPALSRELAGEALEAPSAESDLDSERLSAHRESWRRAIIGAEIITPKFIK